MVWWGSLIEVYSAICRLHGDQEITNLDKQDAEARLRLLSRGSGRSFRAITFVNWPRSVWISILCGRLTASNLLYL